MFTEKNGTNLTKSVNNPKSVLSQYVNYIRKNGPTTKVTLLENVTGLNPINVRKFGKVVKMYHNPKTGTLTYPDTLRGYKSGVLSLSRKYGYLRPVRVGRSVVWTLDVNHTEVV